MDIDLLMIVVMIITITGIIGGSVNAIVQKVLDYKRSTAGIAHSSDPASHAGLPHTNLIADRTDMIEDRLRVLERLATDRGAMLADEIEALRTERTLASNARDKERN
ncbi:hypothetical protein [Qipengyuania sp. ASV99]|uniref:hypothetical protein n=1 Tax=Qipengyuania sp. ASV99 TaxID=3399681 RepID=UPI003A4C7F7E